MSTVRMARTVVVLALELSPGHLVGEPTIHLKTEDAGVAKASEVFTG